jgi:hypothetical protein
MRVKADEFKDAGMKAFEEGNKEQAKYYLKRMRELSPLYKNPSVIKIWADL